MHATDWVRYLVGQREAIQRVAHSGAAIWTGMILVLLTAVARSYDQTLITENPLLWVFGPLLFSFFSGSWLYLITYGAYARRSIPDGADTRADIWTGWRSFMGLFWMTAPIAWLYAIPVERVFESYQATQINLVLLAVVSLWRVILMVRVLQVTTESPIFAAVVWVLFAAAIEVVVVSFFGGVFAQAIMRGMGGMRNSPEEDLFYEAMMTAFGVAFWSAPVLFVVSFFCQPSRVLTALPTVSTGRVHWKPLVVAAVCWIAIAIAPQLQLANNVTVEKLLANGQVRQALDYLSARKPSQFAPGRGLPPKAFEHSVFDDLPVCFAAVRADDAPWVRSHLLHRLTEMLEHYGPRRRPRLDAPKPKREEQIKSVVSGISWRGPGAYELVQVLDGLFRIPEGTNWLGTNAVFVAGLSQAALMAEPGRGSTNDWLILSSRLQQLPSPGLETNSTPRSE